eukprot:scaffold2507_cov122-Isochrysis_galbana.AAC.23
MAPASAPSGACTMAGWTPWLRSHASSHRYTSSGCRCHRRGGGAAEVEPERSLSGQQGTNAARLWAARWVPSVLTIEMNGAAARHETEGSAPSDCSCANSHSRRCRYSSCGSRRPHDAHAYMDAPGLAGEAAKAAARIDFRVGRADEDIVHQTA